MKLFSNMHVMIKFNVEGGQTLELDLNKEDFEKMSTICDKEFPDKEWKTEKLSAIEA